MEDSERTLPPAPARGDTVGPKTPGRNPDARAGGTAAAGTIGPDHRQPEDEHRPADSATRPGAARHPDRAAPGRSTHPVPGVTAALTGRSCGCAGTRSTSSPSCRSTATGTVGGTAPRARS